MKTCCGALPGHHHFEDCANAFHPGDRVEIPAVTATVNRVDKDGDVWVTLDDTRQNWVCKPGRLRKIN